MEELVRPSQMDHRPNFQWAPRQAHSSSMIGKFSQGKQGAEFLPIVSWRPCANAKNPKLAESQL